MLATDWKSALALAPHCALQQEWSYASAIKAQGHEVHHAVLSVDGRIKGLALIAERQMFGPIRIALLMRGPVWLECPDQLWEQLFLAEIRHRLAGAVLLWTPERKAAHETRHSLHGYRRVLTGYSTVSINLCPPIDRIEASLHGKWRNLLRAGRRNDIAIQEAKGGRDLAWVIERNEAHRREIGYAGPSPDFIRSLGQFALPKERLIWLAKYADEPIAGIIIHLHGRTATYYVGCTSPAGRNFRAHHLLLWHAIERLKEKGIQSFDLGGIDTEKAPGVARFKLGMGGDAVTLAGTYLVPPKFNAKKRKEPQSPAALSNTIFKREKAA